MHRRVKDVRELITPPFVLPNLSDEVLTAKFFRALEDPTRLRILRLLLEGERTVSELVAQLGAPQGRVSSHLACLRWRGYVQVRRQGRYAYSGVGTRGCGGSWRWRTPWCGTTGTASAAKPL